MTVIFQSVFTTCMALAETNREKGLDRNTDHAVKLCVTIHHSCFTDCVQGSLSVARDRRKSWQVKCNLSVNWQETVTEGVGCV